MRKLAAIAALIGLAAIAAYPIWQGKFFGVGDMRDVMIPIELFFSQQQKLGHLPTWNPQVAFGFPLLAAGQIGFYYPPLLLARFLPISIYLPIIFLTHIAATGIGMWYLLRFLKLSTTASLFGAMSFMLSAFLWQHTTHLNVILAIAYLPWQVFFTAYISAKPKTTSRDIIWLCFLFGTPLLIGQFQTQAFSAIICIAYSLTVRIKQKQKLLPWITAVAVIGVSAFLFASAQLLPTAELATESSRGSKGEFSITTANQHSFPVYHLPTVLFPRFFGSDSTYWGKRLEIEYGIFIGTLPLISALSWISSKKRKNASLPLKFFFGTTICTFLLALGTYSPIRLLGIEPTFWIFSAPARWLGITTLSLGVLAAAGFDTSFPELNRKKWSWVAGILIGIIVLANIPLIFPEIISSVLKLVVEKLPPVSDPNYYQEKIISIIASAKTSSVSLTSWYTYLPILSVTAMVFIKKSYKKTVLVLTAIELVLIAATTTPTVYWNELLTPSDTLKQLPQTVRTGNVRIYSIREGGDMGGHLTDPKTRPNTHVRRIQKDLLIPLISSQVGVSGIEWPASLDIQRVTDFLSDLREEGGYNIKNTNLVHELGIGAILVQPDLNPVLPGKMEVLSNGIKMYTTPAAPRVSIQTSQQKDIPLSYNAPSMTELDATVVSEEPVTLVVRDLDYPGWKAFIDGQEIEIKRYQTIFRSIEVPAGSHTVKFEYQPRSVRIGLALSSVTFFAFCIMLILFKPTYETAVFNPDRLSST